MRHLSTHERRPCICTASPLAKTCPSIVLLEASPHPISICAECVGDGGAVCNWWIFFSHSSHENYNLTFFVVDS
jgi:hypothetical protein